MTTTTWITMYEKICQQSHNFDLFVKMLFQNFSPDPVDPSVFDEFNKTSMECHDWPGR